MPAVAKSYPPPSQNPEPLPVVAAKLQPPIKLVPRPKCEVKELPNGDLEIRFDVPASEYQKFIRQACGRDMAEFLWEARGLRHFQTQPMS